MKTPRAGCRDGNVARAIVASNWDRRNRGSSIEVIQDSSKSGIQRNGSPRRWSCIIVEGVEAAYEGCERRYGGF